MKCHICYYSSESEHITTCENCGECFCGNCSYRYTSQYSPQGNYCYICENQYVYTKKELVYLRRKNTIDEIFK